MTPIRVASVEPVLVDVPLRTPVQGVHGRTSVQRSVLARVTGTDGTEGWGDVDPTPGYSMVTAVGVHDAIAALAPALRNLEAFDVRRALAVMDAHVAGDVEAKGAIEMALFDLKGRALGVPVHSLLGGTVKDRVTFNAWIGTVPPEQAAREARDWLARGFVTAKIKVAGAGTAGIERVAAVRAAVGDRMALRVDFNESLTAADAVPVIRALEPYGLTLVEQPVPRDQIEALAEIRRATRVPLMADESVTDPASLIEIVRREAADLVKVKVMKQGGLLRTLAMVETAAAAGLRVVIGHGFGLTLSTLAEVAVAAASEAIVDGCESVGPLKMAGDVVARAVSLDTGTIALPGAPGLGATIAPDELKRYRVER
jgi:muconate cycloisomerase